MLSPKLSPCPRSNENPVAFVIVRRNETVRRKNNRENWRGSAIRLHRFESLTSGFRFSYEGIIRGRDYYPSERGESKSGGNGVVAPSRYMHLFNAGRAISLGGKSAMRNGWANFLFRGALRPRTAGISLYYAYTHIYLPHVRLS